MNISSLIPVGVPPELSGEVYEDLAMFLYDHANRPFPDTSSGSAAVRVMVAFAYLEKEGTIEAFRRELWHHRVRPTQT